MHFDFDRYTLRPEATRVLDEAVAALREDADLRIEIEGHTCNIGTAEYNLALGDRRANAVREYLVSRGVSADRLRTVSYGEERPKYDNAREETPPAQSPRGPDRECEVDAFHPLLSDRLLRARDRCRPRLVAGRHPRARFAGLWVMLTAVLAVGLGLALLLLTPHAPTAPTSE